MATKRTYSEILKIVEKNFNFDEFSEKEYKDIFHAIDKLRTKAKDGPKKHNEVESLVYTLNNKETIQMEIEQLRRYATQSRNVGRVKIIDKINVLKTFHVPTLNIAWDELHITNTNVRLIEDSFRRYTIILFLFILEFFIIFKINFKLIFCV